MDLSRYLIAASYFTTDKYWWVYILSIGLFFGVVFVLQAIALYTIASRAGYKLKWLAFIPVVSTYYIGVCAQKNKVFNKVDTRIIGLVAAILELLLLGGSAVYYSAVRCLAAAGCLEWAHHVQPPDGKGPGEGDGLECRSRQVLLGTEDLASSAALDYLFGIFQGSRPKETMEEGFGHK